MMKTALRRAGWVAASAAVVVLAGSLPASARDGAAVPDGTYRFTAKISDGTAYACTGTLVAPQWVLTAADCVVAPAAPLRVVVGKTDLTSSDGVTGTVLRTVRHPSLDLALVRISAPALGIAVPAIRSTAPAADDQVTLLGYGRTATEWVPDRLHRTTATVSTVDAAQLAVAPVTAGEPTTCKGDAGGPAIHDVGGAVELVAVHVAGYQGGCLGASGTRTDGVEARVDVAADWIATTVAPRPRTDFTDDLRADIAGIDAGNALKLYNGDGAGRLTGGTAMLPTGSFQGFHGISAGDFNGDGFADIAGVDANNDMKLYPGNGTGVVAAGKPMLTGSGLWTGFHGFAAGDFNGDGFTDIAGVDANNDMKLYPGNGAGRLSAGTPMLTGSGLWAGFHGFAAGDFNGDGKTDVAGIDAHNDLKLYPGNGAGKLSAGTPMTAGSGNWAGFQAITAGDFNADGRADIAGIDANSDMKLYPGDGAGRLGAGTAMMNGSGRWAGFHGIA